MDFMVYEEDRQRVLKEIDDQIANGEYDTCEYRIECKDGRLLWVHDEGHIVGEENGRKVFYVVIVENMHDVADREQLGKIRTIIDNIPAGIVVYRARGGRQDFVAANPAACRILETTTDAFVNDEQSIFLKRIHESGGDAFVVCLDGKGQVTIDGTEYELSEGDAIVMPAGHPHAIFGKENFKMLLTVVFPR